MLQVLSGEPQELVMTIPLTEPLPSQYCVTAISDRWLGSVTQVPLTFQHLILPESHPPHTGKFSHLYSYMITNYMGKESTDMGRVAIKRGKLLTSKQ